MAQNKARYTFTGLILVTSHVRLERGKNNRKDGGIELRTDRLTVYALAKVAIPSAEPNRS